MNRLTDAERLAWLRLARSEAIGAASFAQLIARFGSAERALEAIPDLTRRAGRGRLPRAPSVSEAEHELEAGVAAGARLCAVGEPDYPPLLSRLDPPPPLLWIIGDCKIFERPAVAIVGARSASAAGARMARALAGELGAAGFVVVSGLARGIDAAAHQGSLASGTIAVLAGGVDQPYPAENAPLYQAIAGSGAALSERPMGHVARAADFPRRNRLISGLALGVVVVEAELRSGSLITARLAGEQGREVFAVPGSPLDPRARGANSLIRQGAHLVEEAADIIEVLHGSTLRLGARAEPALAPAADREESEESDDELREAVLSLVSATPAPIDEIARGAGASTAATLAALTELSLAGRIALLAGGLAALA